LAIEIPTEAQHVVGTPTLSDLQRAHALFVEREPRAAVYDVSRQLLAQALEPGSRLSAAVPVAALLHSWNFAYYNNGPAFDAQHFAALELVLTSNVSSLNSHRERSLEGLMSTDELPVTKLFAAIESVVNRVGAAKTLHLWAPQFFPLWDNPIAQAYGLDFSRPGSKASDYWHFMNMVHSQLKLLPLPDRLKVLDEFNYCRFTKRWM
jgi:hypothetical protein